VGVTQGRQSYGGAHRGAVSVVAGGLGVKPHPLTPPR
jgi:hypothetical protein